MAGNGACAMEGPPEGAPASVDDREESAFAAVWERHAAELRRTGGRTEMALPVGGPPFALSAVIRVPHEIGLTVEETLKALWREHPGHHYYRAAELHLTVLDCTALLAPEGDAAANRIDEAAGRLEPCFHGIAPFALGLRGLNLFPTALVAQVYDADGVLNGLRQRLRRATGLRAGDARAPEMAFVTVARFRAPVHPTLVDIAGYMRRVAFGRFTVREIELVTTDKLFSRRNTTTRRRYNLG